MSYPTSPVPCSQRHQCSAFCFELCFCQDGKSAPHGECSNKVYIGVCVEKQQAQLILDKHMPGCTCSKSKLQLIPVPTPRWPDLLCVYHKTDRLLFTSNMFSAHVAPSVVNTTGESAADVGGWDMYGQDWRHYYDCMLAPVAKQAAGVSWFAWQFRHERCATCMSNSKIHPSCLSYRVCLYATLLRCRSSLMLWCICCLSPSVQVHMSKEVSIGHCSSGTHTYAGCSAISMLYYRLYAIVHAIDA